MFLTRTVVAESYTNRMLDSSWNVMAHGDAPEGKWRGNWRMEWVASTFHTTSEHGVSSITTADAHTSVVSSRLNWRPTDWFKWTRTFGWKTKSGFCACAITFQLASIRVTPRSQVSVYRPYSKQIFISTPPFTLGVHRKNMEWIKSETFREDTLYKATSWDKFPFHLRSRQATVQNWTQTLKILQRARRVCQADGLPPQ